MANGKLNLGGSAAEDQSQLPDSSGESVVAVDGETYPKNKTAISGLRPAARQLARFDGVDEEPEIDVTVDLSQFFPTDTADGTEILINPGQYAALARPTERPFAPIKAQLVEAGTTQEAASQQISQSEKEQREAEELAIVMRDTRVRLGFPEPPKFDASERPTRPDWEVASKRGYMSDAFEKISMLETLYGFQVKWWASDSALERLWGQLNYLQIRVFTDQKLIADIAEVLDYAVLDVVQGEDGEHHHVLPKDLYALMTAIMDRYDGKELLKIISKTR